ncbi:MAG TPA: PIN domain-containing protein [Gemmatimonadaceae bacterium]|nr:PIN domain-containing protein [Gemmatimonadaceae bacterium]
MIAYVDSSVVLRIALRHRGALAEWREITTGVASALVEVECLRTMDRLRHAARLSDDDVALRCETIYRLMEEAEVIELTAPLLRRASQPLPTPLGTLDAIHLATATLWRDERGKDLVIATHDRALATAARASGFRVLGV